MFNPHYGEVDVTLNGEVFKMRLSLGALAELENELEEPSLLALIERFEKGSFRTRDITKLLFAGLRGAGWKGTEDDLLSGVLEGGPIVAARLAGQLLKVTFGPLK